MPPAPTAESGSYRPFTKLPGTEPMAGYKLIEPLGRGGFGEVWKCEAPGGLHKAIKFVPGAGAEDGKGEQRQSQELDAFQQIKSIRHPFLLTLERVEVLDGELVMVMELADRQLQDRFRECRTCGLPGIPRDELLAYFADAAEALDMISAKYGLQHLDVKPANLFLVAGHVKVGDYGLVARLDPDGHSSGQRGLTPKYVAPEALRGDPSSRSDQYSLALVYQELLTGTFPYNGRSAQQIMLQHVSSKPDLSPLPTCDQSIVAQALAKEPEGRFGSCLGFIQALMSVASAASLPGAGMEMRRARVERSRAEMEIPVGEEIDPHDPSTSTGGGRPHAEQTQNFTLPGVPNLTLPGRPGGSLPKLVPANRRPGHGGQPSAAQAPISAYAEPMSAPARRHNIVLNPIRSIVPVGRLIGMESGEGTIAATDFARAVVEHAGAGAELPQMPGDIGRLADGTWVCQFPSTVPSTVIPIKIGIVIETWGVAPEQVESGYLTLRRYCAAGFWGSLSKKKSGFEISIKLPAPGKMVGELTVTGRFFGSPDTDFIRQAASAIPKMLGDVRRELKNVEDRRKSPRVATSLSVSLYPIHSDGGIDGVIHGTCRDVSLGGMCIALAAPTPTKYFYATFDAIGFTAGQGALLRTIRTQAAPHGVLCGAQYRTDL